MSEQNESGQERSEAPTPKRLQKAFDEGQVAKSQELTGAIVLLSALGILATGASTKIAATLVSLLNLVSQSIRDSATIDGAQLITTTIEVGREGAASVAPIVLGIAAMALVTNGLQARGVVSAHPITPKLSHLNPLSGIKRMFGAQSAFTLLKSVVKLVLLATVAYAVVRAAWDEILGLGMLSALAVGPAMGALALKLGGIVTAAFLSVAVLDFFFQLYQHERKLRMTKQEVTREMKETEGDPLIKSRMRSLAMNMRRTRMMQDIPDADVVVTNPTRIAVALKYDPAHAGAPVVVAMGQRKIAKRIREIALKSGIPIIENKPLAQTLLATAQIGEAIPSALYTAVAEVLAFVFRHDRRAPMTVPR